MVISGNFTKNGIFANPEGLKSPISTKIYKIQKEIKENSRKSKNGRSWNRKISEDRPGGPGPNGRKACGVLPEAPGRSRKNLEGAEVSLATFLGAWYNEFDDFGNIFRLSAGVGAGPCAGRTTGAFLRQEG